MHVMWGVVEEVLGPAEDRAAELERLLCRHGFGDTFPSEAMRAARLIPRAVRTADVNGRMDLRDLAFVCLREESELPVDCIIYAEEVAGGAIRLFLSVSDVAHFVPPGSPLDRAAAVRGACIALPNRFVSMLPLQICEQLAGLHAGTDRLAITVEMEVYEDGRTVSPRLHESVVRCASQVAEHFITTADVPSKTRRVLEALGQVAQRLRSARVKRGGHPPSETVCIEEECIIAANEAVAHWMADHHVPALFRVQPQEGSPPAYAAAAAHHASLATDCYLDCHAPLRLYSNLLVHQGLKAAFSGSLPPRTPQELGREATRLNVLEWQIEQLLSAARAL